MAFKFLKRKKEEAEKESKEKIKERKKEKKVKERKTGKPDLAERYIIAPHITEKATYLSEKMNQYIFLVRKEANKIEIKKAIENLYGVKVEKVQIINIPKKKRRRGMIEGWKKGYKKAIVKIKEGQKIEILPR